MQKITKGILITLAGMSLVLSGCAINIGAKSTNKQAKKLRLKKNTASLDFNYPIDIRQEDLNNHTIAILDPHIQADENVGPYIKQFQSALVKQVQEVLEKKGYNIIHLTSARNLTPEQKIKIYSVLKIKGWVGVLEDADINIDNPEDTNMKTTVDQSAGAVLFQFFEPKTGRTTHNFAINVGGEHAITYSYLQQITSSDSFAGANSISLGAVSLVDRNQMDKNRDDAIHTILNKVYGDVIKKLIYWVINTDLKQYRKVIDQIRNKLVL
ncbi:HpaA family protein [Helicobacter suis]|uniref:HpaA family protein n=1 Tax=Helicobacter suis TaxID=104628 RepID=UPI0013D3B82F|nr:HpaA family protein [Helicobacter suis]